MPTQPRIAIVAAGGVLPGAADLGQFWSNVVHGSDCSREVPSGRWNLPADRAYDPRKPWPDRVYSLRGYYLDKVPLEADGLDIDPGWLATLDPVFHLAVTAGRRAWDAAQTHRLDRRRVGVVLGHIALPTDASSTLAREMLSPLWGEPQVVTTNPRNRYVAGLPAMVLARALGLGGGAFALDAACASSLYALELACRELAAGRADAMLAGGLSRPDCQYTQMGFAQLRALSASGRCSPFDDSADGLMVGEGAGVFVLKRLDDALDAGDSILGVIAGTGLSNDVAGNLLAPASEGQLRAMRAAYQKAGWTPESVGLIECHATGTPVGDAVEFASLRGLWADRPAEVGRCVIGAVKSTVGHLLTGAGAAGVLKVLHALRDGVLPPTANFQSAAPGLELDGSPFRILQRAEEWRPNLDRSPRRAAVNGFGFGGVNAHLLIEQWRPASGVHVRVEADPPTVRPAVAIVGLDARFGRHRNLRAFREQILGNTISDPGPAENDWGLHSGIDGCYIDEFDFPLDKFRIPPTEVARLLPQQLLLLQSADAALDDAGLTAALRSERANSTGVFAGVSLDLNTTNYHVRWALEARASGGDERAQAVRDAITPLTADGTMGGLASIAASRVARAFGFGGSSFVVSSEDTSGATALELAVRALERRDLDRAIVGAVDLADVRAVLGANAERPFGPGQFPGEGAATLVLERLDDALAANRRVYAVVRGIGSAGGGRVRDIGPDDDAKSRAWDATLADAHVDPATVVQTTGVASQIGHAGAASALADIVKAALCLHYDIWPASDPGSEEIGPPQFWLHDAELGPRRTSVAASGIGGNCSQAILEEHQPSKALADDLSSRVQPLGAPAEAAFFASGDDIQSLVGRLNELEQLCASGDPIETLARHWFPGVVSVGNQYRVALVARNCVELHDQCRFLRSHLTTSPRVPLSDALRAGPISALRDRVFHSPSPLGGGGQLAFVFPGSGNQFRGMGRELAVRLPQILRGQEAEGHRLLRSQYQPGIYWSNRPGGVTGQNAIFAQVSLGTLVADALRLCVRPAVSVGYSLGESAGLFALRAWRDRDRMYRYMQVSSLFTEDLAGSCRAARETWGLARGEPLDWVTGVLQAPASQVRQQILAGERVYVQIINTPDECVVGGQRNHVRALAQRFDARFVELTGVTIAHCDVLAPVAREYRDLHVMPTTAPAGIQFYSGATGRPYAVDSQSAADAILGHASATIDFPRLVERAYADGVRAFVEIGPGASCTRMIRTILADRPHLARAVCPSGESEYSTYLRTLSNLYAEGFDVDLAALYGGQNRAIAREAGRPRPSIRIPVGVPPVRLPQGGSSAHSDPIPDTPRPAPVLDSFADPLPLTNLVSALAEHRAGLAAAHAAYLRHAQSVGQLAAGQLVQQHELVRRWIVGAADAQPAEWTDPEQPQRVAPVVLNRAKCQEFAAGKISNVLGADFADVDRYPTRVRLPDGPLMLVDRVLGLDGVPRSLGPGRVVTAHDVHDRRWYLDAGRMPTCVTVEAGQADLFLSAYLGIDFQTRGLAVYRLLDAVVAFHRGLPVPGETIRYDIRIKEFFRQGETYLFRFEFDGTIDGEPLLTMRDGCAGFFTPQQLAAGKGVVHTPMQLRPRPGKRSQDWAGLAPLGDAESYSPEQIERLRAGDLAGCFGRAFAGLPLGRPQTIPGGMLRLVHRVPEFDPRGGLFGLGRIVAEADIRPDDWFLTCHFVDDMVMPGTLMYECCLHTFRVALMRLGWVGEADQTWCEPVPGVSSRLKCRGQVVASTRVVTYRVDIKELGYGPEPFAIGDALMFADGRPIVEITDMSLRFPGLSRDQLRATWAGPRPAANSRPALFDRASITAFAVGKPSEAFGDRYRVFDAERVIARLPGPPYQFLDRIVQIENCEPWVLAAGGRIVAEYDVPSDEWYFRDNGQPVMPFAVLLEIALQPCGWLAAYLGSALTSPSDLSFRNLGGKGVQHLPVGPDAGTLSIDVTITKVSNSGGMVIQNYDMRVRAGDRVVYEGDTYFGFFSKPALAQQVGIRDAQLYRPADEGGAAGFAFPEGDPFPGPMLRMIDRVECYLPTGGPAGLGYVRGTKKVDPAEWFFQAHFFQDPVCPGSLGLESFLQLLAVAASRRWGAGSGLRLALGSNHEWIYRGQVVPSHDTVTVSAWVTAADDAARTLTADGFLQVDGRTIYQMRGFTVQWAL